MVFKVQTVEGNYITVFWDMTPYNWVDRYQCLQGTSYLCLQSTLKMEAAGLNSFVIIVKLLYI